MFFCFFLMIYGDYCFYFVTFVVSCLYVCLWLVCSESSVKPKYLIMVGIFGSTAIDSIDLGNFLNFKCAYKRQKSLGSQIKSVILNFGKRKISTKKWQNKKNSFSTLNFVWWYLKPAKLFYIRCYFILNGSTLFSTSDLCFLLQFLRTSLCFNVMTRSISKHCQMLIS